LLNEDLPNNAIFLTKSPTKSGYDKSLLSRFLSIDINRVGRELLLVMSWLTSSVFPLTTILDNTLSAAYTECFFSCDFKSFGVNYNTYITLSSNYESCFRTVAPLSSIDCDSYFFQTSSTIRGDRDPSSSMSGYPSKSKLGKCLSCNEFFSFPDSATEFYAVGRSSISNISAIRYFPPLWCSDAAH
jgi:hypothetical protein